MSLNGIVRQSDERHRPLFNMELVTWAATLMSQIQQASPESPQIKQHYLLIQNMTTKLTRRAATLGLKSACDKGKTTWEQRLDRIVELADQHNNYKKGAFLLFREFMSLMCAMRTSKSIVHRISDPNEAARLLYESFSLLIDREIMDDKKNEGQVKVGCGSSGEVFVEKIQFRNGVRTVNTHLFTGIFADLFCAYTNNHILNEDNDRLAQRHLQALLQLASVHPCSHQKGVLD